MKMVDLIMLFAPYAVFALLANVIIAFDDTEILIKLLYFFSQKIPCFDVKFNRCEKNITSIASNIHGIEKKYS